MPQAPHRPQLKPFSAVGNSSWKKRSPSGTPGPAATNSDDGHCHSVGNNPDTLLRGSPADQPPHIPVMHRSRSFPPRGSGAAGAAAVLWTLFPPLQMMLPTCQQVSMPSLPSKSVTVGRKRVIGTLYGQRKGRATFAVQEDPSSEPLLLLELAVPTGQLVKEMASGTVRVLLECERQPLDAKMKKNKKKSQQSPLPTPAPKVPLWEEPVWTMFCNGRRAGYAASHACGELDRYVQRAMRGVSACAGVLPPPPAATEAVPPSMEKGEKVGDGCCQSGGGCGDGVCAQEVMYMRAKFERVVGSKDSEALYMISPGGGTAAAAGGGSPELCIFLLRL